MPDEPSTSPPATPFPEGTDALRLLFAHHPYPMWLYELETLRVMQVNDAALEAYGYTREQFLALRVPDLHPREDESRLIEYLHAERPPLRRTRDIRHVKRDGSVLEVEVLSSVLPTDRRTVLVEARDVTERRRSQRLQSALYRISETAATAARVEDLYPALHGIVGELMNARNFYIAIAEPGGGIRFPYFVDEFDSVAPAVVPGKTLTEYVLRTRRPLLASPEVFRELATRGEVASVGQPSVDWLGVPLESGGKAFGVLVVQSYSEDVRYTAAEQELLTFVSQHVAAAIERQRAQAALRESEARFRAVAETAPCAIFIYQDEVLLFANDATTEISGYARDELIGHPFWKAVHPEFRELVRSRGEARQRGEPVPTRYELKILRKDGGERWVDFCAGSIEYAGRPAALGTAFDVTERKLAEERVRMLAYRDPVTGLPNRRLFMDRASVAIAQAGRQGQSVAVLFLDLDLFKRVNDSLGHEAGDQLLRGVALRLQGSVREGDTVARMGGDEFTLLLPGLPVGTDAHRLAEKILAALRAPFEVSGRLLDVTGSVGVSLFPFDGADAETLLRKADEAMYRAKGRGRNTYETALR